MFYLNASLKAWPHENFNKVLKKEITTIDADALPLQQGLSHSNFANAENLSATILKVQDKNSFIQVKAGLFYTGIIAGCNCADDPSPVDENTEYCEVVFSIDKETAETTVVLYEE